MHSNEILKQKVTPFITQTTQLQSASTPFCFFYTFFPYFLYWFRLRKLSRFSCSSDTLPNNKHKIQLFNNQRIYSECGFRYWRRLGGCGRWEEHARCRFHLRSVPVHSADVWGSQLRLAELFAYTGRKYDHRECGHLYRWLFAAPAGVNNGLLLALFEQGIHSHITSDR